MDGAPKTWGFGVQLEALGTTPREKGRQCEGGNGWRRWAVICPGGCQVPGVCPGPGPEHLYLHPHSSPAGWVVTAEQVKL